MQLKKKFSLAAQELSHAESAFEPLVESTDDATKLAPYDDGDCLDLESWLACKGIVLFTCQFVIPPEDIKQFDLANATDVAALQELVCQRTNIALCEQHGPAMLRMIASENVTGYDEAYTEVVELEDGGVLVSHGVKPVYQLH